MDRQAIIDRNTDKFDDIPGNIDFRDPDDPGKLVFKLGIIATRLAEQALEKERVTVTLDKEQRHYISLAMSVLNAYDPKGSNIELAHSINDLLFPEV